MKRWMRVVLIIALVLFSVGTIGVIIGAASGAYRSFGSYFQIGIFDDESEDDDMENYTNADESNTINDSIQEIDIDGNYGKVKFEIGDDFGYEVYGLHGNTKKVFSNEVNNGVWNIKVNNRSGISFFGFGSDERLSLLRIYVPKDANLKKIHIDMDAGTVDADELIANDVDVDMDAGSFVCQKVEASESFKFKVSAGRINIENMKGVNGKFDCGAGQISASGIVTGQNKLDCGMGQISLKLQGAESDYDYKAQCGLGNIKIGGTSYSGVSSSNAKQTGLENFLDLDCGMGQISVQFNN